MSFRAGNSSFNLKRGEWSGLLLAAVCALLLTAPAQSTPLAAPRDVSGASYEAVLRWLHSARHDIAAEERRAAVITALCASGAFDAPAAESLLASLEAALPALSEETQHEVEPLDASAAPAHQTFTILSPAQAPRLDDSRRLLKYSLTSHEAATRSGVRTNRFLE